MEMLVGQPPPFLPILSAQYAVHSWLWLIKSRMWQVQRRRQDGAESGDLDATASAPAQEKEAAALSPAQAKAKVVAKAQQVAAKAPASQPSQAAPVLPAEVEPSTVTSEAAAASGTSSRPATSASAEPTKKAEVGSLNPRGVSVHFGSIPGSPARLQHTERTRVASPDAPP